jgi:hypothetical protein
MSKLLKQNPITHQKGSWKKKLVQLRLTWDNGRELIVNDYKAAAESVGKSVNTVMSYLIRDNGITKFKNPKNPTKFIILTKEVLEKPAKPETYYHVYHEPPENLDGYYSLLEAVVIAGMKSPQALKKKMTSSDGSFQIYTRNGEMLYVNESTWDSEQGTPPLDHLLDIFGTHLLYKRLKELEKKELKGT